VFQLIANFLAAIYGLVNNYAIAIALLTLAIMVVVTPLTLKSTKSMLEMQRIQPEMKKLQAQYKNDRQKLNEEMMALYREHKINPLGGCLPLLLQAPVFIIMYRVLRGLTQKCSTGIGGEVAKALGVPANKLSCTPGTIHPGYIKSTSKLFQHLNGQKQMLSFGLDLAKPAAKVIGESLVKGLPYLALVLIVAATSYYQQKQISARASNQAVNPQQQMILRVMPAFFGLISLTFPSGLIVYFLVQNLFRIGQNAYITRKFYAEPPPDADDDGRSPAVIDVPDKPKPSSGPKGGGSASPKRPTPPRPAPKGRVTPPKPAPGNRPTPRPSRPSPSGDRPSPRPGTRPAPKKK
jgi:YidC/Oxa1 family membrane protein insertase